MMRLTILAAAVVVVLVSLSLSRRLGGDEPRKDGGGRSLSTSTSESETSSFSSCAFTSLLRSVAHSNVVAAAAPEEPRLEGRLIRFTVSNLDGEEGIVGTFTIRTRPSWSPLGAARLEELVESSFWNDCRFFRVVPNFVVQFGINGDPETQSRWRNERLADDPVVSSNVRGTVTFATSGANTRTTQLFVNVKDNTFLDQQGFSPVAEVVGDGMSVVDRAYDGYGERPDQGRIQTRGNAYLEKKFPKLTYVVRAEFVGDEEEEN